LGIKSSAWNKKKNEEIDRLGAAIVSLEAVDIDAELLLHATLKQWLENSNRIRDLNKQKATYETAVTQAEKAVDRHRKALESLLDKKCPACEQHIHDHKHEEMTETATKNLEDSVVYLDTCQANYDSVLQELSDIGEQGRRPEPFYDTETEALGHKNNLDQLTRSLEGKVLELNPYDEQIEELKKTAIQEISWVTINDLIRLRDHQDFLHKLLTNKDSFIRKRIIDQNLSYLNKRLSYYIDKLGLPHTVIFQNDLTVEITQLGQDLDFDNLSRGERNRLILSMSFAFRDVWEGLYQHINLLFVDELMDSGMDSAGVEAGLAVLKKMARERNKNIYLISHKDELVGRVNNVLRVVKESGFTSYSNSLDYVN
jgi:hypothetical protein